jgi:DNA topoisomerase-1
MKLIVCESPTKATKIGHILGDEYMVLASFGHLCDLAKGGKFGIGIDSKFNAKYILMKDKEKVLQSIMDAAEKSDEILLFTDPDREGMAIAYHIKRYLSSLNKPVKIGLMREITEKGIKQVFDSLGDIDMKLFKAQEARRILDRIVGFMVSPFLITHYGNGNSLSAGRVQSVAVRMIVDREKDIETFKPEEYWNIFGQFSINDRKFVAKLNKKVSNEKDATKLIDKIKINNDFFVLKVKEQKKKEYPQPPLITSKLQQNAAKQFDMSPDRVMKAAQSLYENGYCTYIRTDSTRIAEEAIQSARKWLKDNIFDIPKSPNIYTAKVSAQDAHECIRPTDINIGINNSLTGDERDIYKLIWQYFIASQMNPAIWNTLSIEISSKSEPTLQFRTTGKALEYKGYLEIFGNAELSNIDLPFMHQNDQLFLISTKKEQKFTQPPPRYNEASINEELEAKQIGRPSTYAEIINKITARNYVEKKGQTYRPTELGKKITDILVKLFPFVEYGFTANLEKQLDEIAEGNLEQLKMLNDFFIPFKEQLNNAYIAQGADICIKCDSPMVLRTNSKTQQKFLACTNYQCHTTKSVN